MPQPPDSHTFTLAIMRALDFVLLVAGRDGRLSGVGAAGLVLPALRNWLGATTPVRPVRRRSARLYTIQPKLASRHSAPGEPPTPKARLW